MDLLRGVSYCSCDVLSDHNTSLVDSGGFINLPVELLSYHRSSHGVVEPRAYRTMGVVSDSFIRFVSIDGFKIKKRTLTVWRLLGHDQGWEKEHEFSMETLQGFQGFTHLPNNLAPIYPLLSTKDKDVVYLALLHTWTADLFFRPCPEAPITHLDSCYRVKYEWRRYGSTLQSFLVLRTVRKCKLTYFYPAK